MVIHAKVKVRHFAIGLSANGIERTVPNGLEHREAAHVLLVKALAERVMPRAQVGLGPIAGQLRRDFRHVDHLRRRAEHPRRVGRFASEGNTGDVEEKLSIVHADLEGPSQLG